MRNNGRKYTRKNGAAIAGGWFLVCCVVLALIVALKVCVPDLNNRVESAFAPVIERTEQYKDAFTHFGEALSGDKSLTDAFTGILNLGKQS